MSTVKLQKLGTLCKMQSGGTPSRKNDKFWDNGNILWAKISDLESSPDGYIYKTEEKITESGLTSINNRVFSENTLFLAMYGSVGKVAISKVPMSTNQAILGINIIDDKVLDLKFLKHWVSSIKGELLDKAVGVALKNISLGLVKDLQIPLPPLEIQKAIAEKLDKADALRKKDQELLTQYDELAQAIFIDMFGDPVQNEKGWDFKTLKEITTKIGSGSTPKGGKENYKSEGISLIRSMNVYDREFLYKDLAFIDDEQASKLKNVIVEEGDVLFNITGASVCRSTIVPINLLPARVNQHVSIIRAKKDIISNHYLNSLLISDRVKKQLLKIGAGGGAVMEAITKEQLENFKVILPPISLQNQFTEKIKNIEAQKTLVKQQAEESENLFQALLQESFNFN